MTLVGRVLAVQVLAAGAIFVGLVTGLGIISVANWIAPFRLEDDETLREVIPAGLAYLGWVIVSLLTFGFGLRALLARWRRRGSSDIQRR